MIETQIKEEFKRRMEEESLMRINACLDHMTEENIWYSPNENVNSVGNLVLHLCGNINQYINTTLGNENDTRKRSLEFSAHNSHNRKALQEKITETIKKAVGVVDQKNLSELIVEYDVQGFKEKGIAIVIHVIEHTSYHTGQITTICKWLENVDTKYYDGLDLNITHNN